MTNYVNKGDTVLGKRLIFVGQKIGNPQVIPEKKKHRKQRVKLYDGRCWIETPIDLPKG